MKRFALALLVPALFSGVGAFTGLAGSESGQPTGHGSGSLPSDQLIREYCARCHGTLIQKGEMSLERFRAGAAEEQPELAEKIIRKLRAGMMPPAGQRRPDAETLAAFATVLEARVDRAAALEPEPGRRTFQRLNRAEYEASIRELLDLDMDAGDYLPLDTKSANFDNIADTQILSATLLNSYLTAAAEVSRMAVGDVDAPVRSATYSNPGWASQWERVEGAPRGTRGGVSAVHNFPADAEYVFEMAFEHNIEGFYTGSTSRNEQLDISVDGERVALMEVDQFMHVSDPNGARMWTDPIFVPAGPHRVSAAFLRTYEGPIEDPLSPYDWSLVTRGYAATMTVLAHIKDLVVKGPFDPTGVSETPSRRKIFNPYPASPAEERPCAEAIISRLGTRAWRGPLPAEDFHALMGIYEEAAAEGGFELGVRTALQTILSSPRFVFRVEKPADDVEPGESYRIGDLALASRLSFFLWGSIPDEELLDLAMEDQLSDPDVLAEQVQRMLADPRSKALATRFAAQWLRLDDLEKVHPDRLANPNFYSQLADMMRRETELFFEYLVREDRSLLELLTADYTFVNGPLAKHYGIVDVSGSVFRRVELADENRRGLLGQASVLMQTSHADRTSPVLRGKWVMEVLFGSPPPPPPPDVPEFDETDAASDGRLLTVAERLEMHRANPVCNSCHRMIDPIGIALENFDVTGRWRIKDNLNPIISDTEMHDGTEMNGPIGLRKALLRYPHAFTRTFIENLMAYGLGRRIEYYDMPSVRKIERDAAARGNRMSAIITGIVNSPAFQMGRMEAAESSGEQRR
jgi:hypothetical protein